MFDPTPSNEGTRARLSAALEKGADGEHNLPEGWLSPTLWWSKSNRHLDTPGVRFFSVFPSSGSRSLRMAGSILRLAGQSCCHPAPDILELIGNISWQVPFWPQFPDASRKLLTAEWSAAGPRPACG